MKKILELEKKIRGHVNKSIDNGKKFEPPDKWKIICISLDTIGDTCLALEHYEDYGLGNEWGEIYLKLYGFFQAIILEQDAIKALYYIFLEQEYSPTPDSFWLQIRDIRNFTTGHPVDKSIKIKGEKNNINRCSISRSTIEKDNFKLYVWDRNRKQEEFRDINIGCLLDSYKIEAIKALEDVNQAALKKCSGD